MGSGTNVLLLTVINRLIAVLEMHTGVALLRCVPLCITDTGSRRRSSAYRVFPARWDGPSWREVILILAIIGVRETAITFSLIVGDGFFSSRRIKFGLRFDEGGGWSEDSIEEVI
jgi:hypothetical protein